MRTIFLTGIHTDAGKTIASAIVCKALQFDYWKPIQSGYPEDSDTRTVKSLLKDDSICFHPEQYLLKAPLSPHAAAELEGVVIQSKDVIRPVSENLLIEGAGGLLVPINSKETLVTLLKPKDKIILVSRHYLGSINHTLLSISLLNQLGYTPGVLFIGKANPSTEDAILSLSESTYLGRIDEVEKVDSEFIENQSNLLKKKLEEWLMD